MRTIWAKFRSKKISVGRRLRETRKTGERRGKEGRAGQEEIQEGERSATPQETAEHGLFRYSLPVD
jgi:hypothetical protein